MADAESSVNKPLWTWAHGLLQAGFLPQGSGRRTLCPPPPPQRKRKIWSKNNRKLYFAPLKCSRKKTSKEYEVCFMGCSPCRKLCSFIICRTWLALCFDFRIPEAKFLLFERKQFDLNYLNLHFLYQKFSLRNPKKFRTFEPFKLSNARFFYPYKQRKKFRTQPSFVRKRCKICNAKPWAFFLRLKLCYLQTQNSLRK